MEAELREALIEGGVLPETVNAIYADLKVEIPKFIRANLDIYPQKYGSFY